MSALTGNDWQATEAQSAEALAAPSTRPFVDKLIAIRDTLIVLGMQLVFRITMFLRHLNY
jgi:hypothetical protein